uniref:Lipocalin/cytosolic fatty-acid binding domain-containing protein n=1 Tax=Catagonus wagneri TaxID=51154 RepID=A0A8C3YDM9_9CETA
MKVLLLSLVLGLVCAQEPQPEPEPLQLSGKWKTHYIAASNQEKTRENGPFHVYFRSICLANPKDTVSFRFFVKVNGKCVQFTIKGTKKDNKDYDADYAGKNKFKIIHVSKNALIGYNENVDEEGKITKMTIFFGKGNKTEAQDLEKFKELTREKGIPEENIVHILKTDDCPSSE